LNVTACIRPVGLQQRALGHYGHGFFDGAHLHPQIDANRGVDRHVNAIAQEPLESAQLGLDAVRAVF